MASRGQMPARGALYAMPLDLHREAPTILVRRPAWERSGLTRAEIDEHFGLTDNEFRVEGSLVAIGPLYGDEHLEQLVMLLEKAGLIYYEEFFELSGNWPEWVTVHVLGA